MILRYRFLELEELALLELVLSISSSLWSSFSWLEACTASTTSDSSIRRLFLCWSRFFFDALRLRFWFRSSEFPLSAEEETLRGNEGELGVTGRGVLLARGVEVECWGDEDEDENEDEWLELSFRAAGCLSRMAQEGQELEDGTGLWQGRPITRLFFGCLKEVFASLSSTFFCSTDIRSSSSGLRHVGFRTSHVPACSPVPSSSSLIRMGSSFCHLSFWFSSHTLRRLINSYGERERRH